jgi:hypothetical protein
MLPLLEFSLKKEQLLQEYSSQLEPHLDRPEPWEHDHHLAMLIGDVESFMKDILALWEDLQRIDAWNHYYSAAESTFPYVQMNETLENILQKFPTLLNSGLRLASKLQAHGYTLKWVDDLEKCLQTVNALLKDDGSSYTTPKAQVFINKAIDEIKAGDVLPMTRERL